MTPGQDASQWAATRWQRGPATPRVTPEQRYRQSWSQTLIDRGKARGDIPLFGSRAWCELPDNDPRKAAAAVRAAETWAREGDDLAFDVAQEAYNRRRSEDEYWAAVHAERKDMVADQLHRTNVREHRAKTSYSADLAHGYKGGPVEWETGTPWGDDEDTDGHVRDGAIADDTTRSKQAAAV
ncbi:DUF2742 domain-containing protein [Nocardiopsis sp. NRRL B-16309]|uniref:DUF2742 domain-containing protein n=1 Tax=Nocardiopsis sp. NRRL B-16309 TaxID=1519494 RepID=UPI0018D12C25|nr:DUF2742 domain-containing protein [Nocardiopsis sp. NRRL B-16309]